MSDLTKVTIDHDEIRRWVEERHGVPARVKGTGDNDDPGLLRIDFPVDGPDPNLEPISWDEWFRKFDEKQLAFLYEEKMANGTMSYFNKLVSRETVNDQLEAQKKQHSSSTSREKSSSDKGKEAAGRR
ncbi:MAG: 1,4-alpha-glucan branching enzyme [Bryobacterales bacterium]|nr:1,4-alpha-glucan branching enzyme [Bryobacterales bacterium]